MALNVFGKQYQFFFFFYHDSLIERFNWRLVACVHDTPDQCTYDLLSPCDVFSVELVGKPETSK